MNDQDSKGRKTDRKNFWRTLRYITHYWQLKVVLALVVVNTILATLSPSIIGSIIDVVKSVATGTPFTPTKGMGVILYQILNPISTWVLQNYNIQSNTVTLGVFTFSLIFVAGMTGLLSYVQRYLSAYVNQGASFSIRNDLYNSLLEQSYSFYDQQRTGQLMSRATSDISQLNRFYNISFNTIISTLLTAILVLYNVFLINTSLTVIYLVLVPIAMYTAYIYAKKIRPIWAQRRQQFGDITSVLQENLMGLRVVKGFAMESYEESKLSDVCETYLDSGIKSGKIMGSYGHMGAFITSIGTIFIFWYGGIQVMNGLMTVGSLVAFYLFVQRLQRPIRTFSFMTSSIQRAMTAADRIFDVIDAEVDVSNKEDAIELGDVEGKITFEKVGFSYDGQNLVLKNINIEALPGQTVAILGGTGSGKSTIINLIPRFYDVTQGKITVDGTDLRDVTIKSLRKHIGIVRQDPFIFSTTLRENIAFGMEDAMLEDIKVAAERANIADFIESQPNGYDTTVGERGVTVSGGQKQRLAIARALLKNPKILILDDSTSSVDTETEFEIQRALKELFVDRTTFIITQRLSSVKDADYIIVMEDGEIVEEGHHEELMANEENYFKLYQTQIAEARREEVEN
jgi:ABC-type multidrug transport system fused ATPase/permease subunit